MRSTISLAVRIAVVPVLLSGFTLVAAACSDDKTDTGGSSGSSGSSGTSGTTGTSGGGGTVVFEDSGTTTPPAGGNCTSVSSCEGALCKCVEGPNKDKSCQKTDNALASYCDKLCKFCK